MRVYNLELALGERKRAAMSPPFFFEHLSYPGYATFFFSFLPLNLAQRARCVAAILLRAAEDSVC
jgi:hypothetical protein